MNSMTGFGRGAAASGAFSIQVEISSVNRKQLEIRFVAPREASYLDALVRDALQSRLSRGAVSVNLRLDHAAAGAPQGQINIGLLESYGRAAIELHQRLGLPPPADLSPLFALPGVTVGGSAELPEEEVSTLARQAVKQALEGLCASRAAEGARLRLDLEQRITLLESWRDELEQLAGQSVASFRERLLDRIREAGLEMLPDDERLLKEVVLFADRSDVTEEMVRLKGHLSAFRALLARPGAVGREMDFLAQETGREINTTGSKSQDSAMSRLVVSFKAELERIREQIQNLE
ncbi:MAG: hypothetical protein RL095_1403 [Verrucomicrobiota bacterium]|jgi:uncharacterized protein (TIGR00255 family)